MNAKTAKLIRKYCESTGYPHRATKCKWNHCLKRNRAQYRKHMRAAIEEAA